MNIVVDTDILIDFSFDKSETLSNLLEKQHRKEANLFINPVIITEYLTDQKLINNRVLENEALEFLHSFDIVEITEKEAILVARLLREKRIIFLGDAYIAATCLTRNFKLATRNKKHFKQIPQLKFYEIDSLN
ncbi:PIN domain-containing protein [Candidatus Gottesmanbacteria bacterium]|nr:PIN domain-containing protein [Candidatus Gottesmanbacteria bacterium]MBI5452760.1 PIN domain-containing protein [Candidatus Gottesmanbacteria bacterium]